MPGHVFFEGDWPYRTWRSLVMLIAGLACCPMFFRLLAQGLRGQVYGLQGTLTFLLLFAFSGFFAYAGLLAGWRFFTRAKSHLRIDGQGISYGETSVPWEQIGRVYVVREKEGLHFAFNRKSRGWLAREH